MNLSARGSRHLDDGVEKIDDPTELTEVRKQARSVWIKSLLSAALLLIFAMALP